MERGGIERRPKDRNSVDRERASSDGKERKGRKGKERKSVDRNGKQASHRERKLRKRGGQWKGKER